MPEKLRATCRIAFPRNPLLPLMTRCSLELGSVALRILPGYRAPHDGDDLRHHARLTVERSHGLATSSPVARSGHGRIRMPDLTEDEVVTLADLALGAAVGVIHARLGITDTLYARTFIEEDERAHLALIALITGEILQLKLVEAARQLGAGLDASPGWEDRVRAAVDAHADTTPPPVRK